MKSVADLIREAPDTVIANVKVPEWGGIVLRLKSWNAGERIAFDEETAFLDDNVEADDRKKLNWARAVARSLIESDDSPAYKLPTRKELDASLQEGGDLAACLKVYTDLTSKSAKGLYRLFKVCSDLNALSEDDEADIEKN